MSFNPEQAATLVAGALADFLPPGSTPAPPESRIMADLKLESIDLMTLLLDLERRSKSRLDLAGLLGRAASAPHGRGDLTVQDLCDLLCGEQGT